jgi:CheY-like chemotaxis protein
MQETRILWADDEIDLLKPLILFLEQKGFKVIPVTNGLDALDVVKKESLDLVFLDEHMPGISGIETLSRIKQEKPSLPVVMITKSEEERIMEDAIGSKIADYLIKPVNPHQILLACKKILDNRRLVEQKTQTSYQEDFRKISLSFFDDTDAAGWAEIYRKLVYWELELEKHESQDLREILFSQKAEANGHFAKFIQKTYPQWMSGKNTEAPILSPDVLGRKVFPVVTSGEQESVFFILIDCLRYDQWKVFEQIIEQYYTIQDDSWYYAILPTATQYARNAIFAGMYPDQIAERFPKYWKDDDEEGGKNLFEGEMLTEHLQRKRLSIKHQYRKVVSNEDSKILADTILDYLKNDLNAFVFNFIDMLSHSRTEMNMIRELAPDESAYRSLSRSWLEHSPFLQILKKLKDKKVKIIITSDHGTVRVQHPVKIIGDRTTTTNLRYKQGRNLGYDESRFLMTVKNPSDLHLPKMGLSARYVFTTEDYFFAYPNNYNHYVNMYRDTFQHGGISMEEMIVPLITLVPK